MAAGALEFMRQMHLLTACLVSVSTAESVEFRLLKLVT